MRNIYLHIKNEAGITLVESLAAITIFMLIVIPLSSSYLHGIEVFQKTQKQVSLRNEADIIIGTIMNEVQKKNYIESGSDSNQLLYELLSSHLSMPKDIQEYTQSIFLYEIQNDIDGSKPPSLKKTLYSFATPLPDTIKGAVPQNVYKLNDYYVDGLFYVDNISQKLNYYLVIANPKEFTGENKMQQITDYINSHRNFGDNVYFVETSMAINGLKRR
ncbi:type IV pilus modification PilV family protein [Aneurinibacillus tyrosinisolvens]|uniref:type IV pilus modification PilV family protein n=1 Tax=Aneurinibacillus tyrosinisolvens TaxID=1443435 RepID=UPI00063FBC8D|nr:hypothetical protein [Aneurinibacillus tyrosinisolvens]